MGARDVYSLAPFLLCSPRGGPVRCLTLVTLRALIEAFLGNSDCATALLFPPGQMPSTGVAGLPGRRVGAQHRCAPTIIWSGGFLGATRRGWATHRVGDASRRPYNMVGRDFWGVALLRRGDAPRGGAMHRGGRRAAWGGDAPRGRRNASPRRYGRVGFLGAWHRCAGAYRYAPTMDASALDRWLDKQEKQCYKVYRYQF